MMNMLPIATASTASQVYLDTVEELSNLRRLYVFGFLEPNEYHKKKIPLIDKITSSRVVPEMSQAEKFALSGKINSIRDELNLQHVVELVRDRNPNAMVQSSDAWTFDLQNLGTEVLWALDTFVTFVLQEEAERLAQIQSEQHVNDKLKQMQNLGHLSAPEMDNSLNLSTSANPFAIPALPAPTPSSKSLYSDDSSAPKLTTRKRKSAEMNPNELQEHIKSLGDLALDGNKPFKINLMIYDLGKKNGDKPYVCDACGKSFSDRSNLSQHIRVHTDEKPYVCSYCNKGFAYSVSLKEHMYTHTGEKPFACDHCGRTFAQSANLKRHTRLHTGEKPFSCTHCNKSFSQSSNLKQHIQRVHVPKDVKKAIKNSPSSATTSTITPITALREPSMPITN